MPQCRCWPCRCWPVRQVRRSTLAPPLPPRAVACREEGEGGGAEEGGGGGVAPGVLGARSGAPRFQEEEKEEEEEVDASDLLSLSSWPRSSKTAAVACVQSGFPGHVPLLAVFPLVVDRPEMLGIMAGLVQKDSYAPLWQWHVQGWFCW